MQKEINQSLLEKEIEGVARMQRKLRQAHFFLA